MLLLPEPNLVQLFLVQFIHSPFRALVTITMKQKQLLLSFHLLACKLVKIFD